jgi:hypothetical protein
MMMTHGLVKLLETLRGNIAAFDERIAELVRAHPDSALFDSLPGAGAVLIPRLIVAFGTRRERYESAYQMQCYSGIAPVKEASGKTEWVHFRFTCPKFLRQTFHEFAGHSIGKSEWAKAYYEHLTKDEKKSHHAAVRSLAYKCRFDHSKGPKTWKARNVLLLRANGYSPEPCSGPPSRSLLPQAELCRASGWRSGSDRGCRLRFRCLLSGMPPRFPFSPQPVFAGLA